jgi:adenylate cyclase
MKKNKFYKILFLSAFWVCSTAFIVLYEGAALGFPSTVAGVPYRFYSFFIFAILLSAPLATSAAVFEVLCFSRLLRKQAFGLSLMIKTLFYLVVISLFHSATAILVYSHDLNLAIFDRVVLGLYIQDHIVGARLFMSVAYYGIVVVIALFVVQASEKFGQGVLVDLMLGRYHRPKQADRIFMFMDLKSSATYAEQLGHIHYSRLIQDCFYELTDVVTRYGAKIYQYVGDEVVLTWEIDHGLKNGNCLRAFFAYDRAVKRNGAQYQKKFGLIPEFKAALNMGEVTVAEVGELKKELAYHGDVIITAARIQEKCNEFGARVLVSETMMQALGHINDFEFEPVGNILLKGKAKPVNLYKVSQSVSRYPQEK